MFTYVTIVVKLSSLFSHGFIKCAWCLMWVFVLIYLTYQVPIVAQNFNYFVRTYALIWVLCYSFTCNKIALTIAECFFFVFCHSALYFLVKFFRNAFPCWIICFDPEKKSETIYSSCRRSLMIRSSRMRVSISKKRRKGVIISMFLCSVCCI